jgi:hypothetical protein
MSRLSPFGAARRIEAHSGARENAHTQKDSYLIPRAQKEKYSMASLCSLFSSECKSPDCVDYHPLFLSRSHSAGANFSSDAAQYLSKYD